MEVLENIDQFPLNLDTNLTEYYQKIAGRIVYPSKYATKNPYNDRAYIQKIKPFFINHKIYYEVTFTVANDKASKFDRVIAFTKLELSDNYAVKLSIHNDYIDVLGKIMPIQVIDSWEVSIRPCEINRFADIFGIHTEIGTNNVEFRNLMQLLPQVILATMDYQDFSEGLHTPARIIELTEQRHLLNSKDFDNNIAEINAMFSLVKAT